MVRICLPMQKTQENMSLIPGSGRSPGGGKWQPTAVPQFSIEEPGGLQSVGLLRVGHD